MKKYNHSGVSITIPDETKQTAIVVMPNGKEIRVGTKAFESVDVFVPWLESQVMELRNFHDNQTRAENKHKASRVIFEEAATAIDNLAVANFETVDEFVETVINRAANLSRLFEDTKSASHVLKVISSEVTAAEENLKKKGA